MRSTLQRTTSLWAGSLLTHLRPKILTWEARRDERTAISGTAAPKRPIVRAKRYRHSPFLRHQNLRYLLSVARSCREWTDPGTGALLGLTSWEEGTMSYAQTSLSTLPLPASYNPPVNLPGVMRNQPMVLLRDKLYPKFKGVVERTLEARNSFHPFAILPTSYGPFSHPVGGAQAVVTARGDLMNLRHVAAVTNQAPCLRRFLTPHAVYSAPTQGSLPGYGVHNVNFRPASSLPQAVEQRRNVLANRPSQFIDPRTRVVMNRAAIQARQARANVLVRTL